MFQIERIVWNIDTDSDDGHQMVYSRLFKLLAFMPSILVVRKLMVSYEPKLSSNRKVGH